ncbi:MAG: hypothetical protein HY744_26240 [Deltaproteobacteria bacterium]|nr:hypothetical protein [Deltaproteobacteria bacterium]
MRVATLAALGSLAAALLSGCRKGEQEHGTPAPAGPGSPAPQATEPAGRAVCLAPARYADPQAVRFLPKIAGPFCLDPSGSDRAYGEGAARGVEGICDVLDGECETYKRFGVRRLVEARYVDGGGGPAMIDVYLSELATTEHAYAMFTLRVVGESDPARPGAPRPMQGGGEAALGVGSAYLWRGPYLAELSYSDPGASPPALRAAADRVLPALVADLGDRILGPTEPPAAVAALPPERRLPLGVQYAQRDVLGVAGAGAGAVGYYMEGDRRWRVLSVRREDAAQSAEVFRTFAGLPGANEEKGIGDAAVWLTLPAAPGGAQAQWLLARRGKAVLGVGDESALGQPLDRAAKRRMLAMLLEPR